MLPRLTLRSALAMRAVQVILDRTGYNTLVISCPTVTDIGGTTGGAAVANTATRGSAQLSLVFHQVVQVFPEGLGLIYHVSQGLVNLKVVRLNELKGVQFGGVGLPNFGGVG